jgi:hypothetical protein
MHQLSAATAQIVLGPKFALHTQPIVLLVALRPTAVFVWTVAHVHLNLPALLHFGVPDLQFCEA